MTATPTPDDGPDGLPDGAHGQDAAQGGPVGPQGVPDDILDDGPAPPPDDGVPYKVYRTAEGQAQVKAALEEASDADYTAKVEKASRRIEQALSDHPYLVGESREAGRRILFDSPLACLYEVDETRKLVTVIRTWPTKRPFLAA
jgi:hypothetical protein